MTTEQQAREALDALDDYARMANIEAVGPLKVLSDFITQAAKDKSARNLLEPVTFEQYRDQLAVGNLTALDQIGFDNLLHDRLEQAAEDKRIADAVRGGERFWRAVWGETADGKVTIDREEIVGIPASVLEGE